MLIAIFSPVSFMPLDVLDEANLRDLSVRERLDRCIYIIKNDVDESKRWDAVYLAGEIAEATSPKDPIFDEVADLMSWILKNDNNCVIKHEACFQIAARNMRKKIPDMISTALNDESGVAKHEALECLALMRAFESREDMIKALDDPIPYVSETAAFALKRLDRLEKTEIYQQSKIL
ncbi:MAG TPA: HEAT repeat domain-containing protein [Nitrosopumilaceae archaeon]|nr:HEAT repeat domain-containing protein [Nitrosopumilaceae archaeon]